MTEKEFFDQLRQDYHNIGLDVDLPSAIFKSLKGELIEFSIDPVKMVYRMPVQTAHLNQFGQMHGGYITLLLDSIMGTLAHYDSKPCVTSQLNTSYVNPLNEDHVIIEATIVTRRKRQTIVNGIARNDAGEIKANAQGTFIAVA